MGPARSQGIENSKRPKSACPRVTSAPSDWSAGSAVLRSISLFAGSIDESPNLGPEKLHARERGGSVVFSSLHEVSVSVTKLFPVVARAETGGDRRWEDGPPRSYAHHWRCSSPRACARLAGAGSCGSPYERCVRAIRPVRCRPNCSADDAFFAGQTVVVGSVRVRSARGVRVHTVHAAHERLWQVYAVYGGFFIALSYLWGEHPRRRNPKSKTHPHHPTDSPPQNSATQGTDWTDSSPTWVTWSGVRCV